MHTLFEALIDIVFPPSEQTRVVRAMDVGTARALVRVRHVGAVCALAPFGDARVRALIHEAKFHDNRKAFVLLAEMLGAYLRNSGRTYDMIVPVPLAPARRRARGYNQVEEVLRAMEPEIRALVRTRVLARTRDTRPQTELGREERLQNVRDAFGVADPSPITGAHILLIDDVLTTGATLRAAKAALEAGSPASVTCLTFAH